MHVNMETPMSHIVSSNLY